MLEIAVLILFMAILFSAIIFKFPIALALFINLIVLTLYAYKKKFSPREIFKMISLGIRDTKTILLVFSLIGMITGILATVWHHCLHNLSWDKLYRSKIFLCWRFYF